MPKGEPYSAEFKARVVLETLQGAKTVNELAAEHDLNPNLVRNWKAKAESGLSRVFSATEDECARERELAMSPGGGRRPPSRTRRAHSRARLSSTGPA